MTMHLSRRDWGRSLALLIATSALGREEARLSSKAYRFEDLPVRSNGQNRFWPILKGVTHEGLPLEVHQSELAPGERPHPPHRHKHEEMFLVREGVVEFTVEGKSTKLGPGSAAFVASNDEHGIRNAGTTAARYFVVALGKD